MLLSSKNSKKAPPKPKSSMVASESFIDELRTIGAIVSALAGGRENGGARVVKVPDLHASVAMKGQSTRPPHIYGEGVGALDLHASTMKGVGRPTSTTRQWGGSESLTSTP